MAEDIEEFKSYSALAHQLIDGMSKEQVAECLHVMAVHLAEYQRRFGEIPRPDLLELAGATELNEQQTRLVRVEWNYSSATWRRCGMGGKMRTGRCTRLALLS